jgi:hypothetical protein
MKNWADHPHRLTCTRLTQYDHPTGRNPVEHVHELIALPGQVSRADRPGPPGGGKRRPAPLDARFTSETHSTARSGSAAVQETGNG